MAAPITWRNVDSQDQSRAALPLAYAQQSINGAFDSFNNIIKQRQAVDASNLAVTQEAQKQGFLDQLSQARTPEQLAQLQSSGQLDSMLAGMSPQNRAAVRGADEARLTSLRQQGTATNAFNDSERARVELPQRDEIASAAANGEFARARELVAKYGLRDSATLLSGINTAERTKLTQGRADETSNLQLSTAKLNQTEAERKAAEAGETRRANDFGAKFAQNYQESAAAQRDGVMAGAAQLGIHIPVRTDGSIDLGSMDSTQVAAADEALNKAGFPTITSATSGDSQFAAVLKSQMQQQGFRPADIASVGTQFASLLSTAPGPAIGNDAANIERLTRAQDAAEASGQMRFGTVATPGSMDTLADAAVAAINQVTEEGSWKRQEYTEEVMNLIRTGGIKEGDFRVLPSAQTLKQLILGSRQSMFTFDRNEIKNQLKSWSESSEAKAGASEAIKAAANRRIRGVDSEKVR